MSSSSPHPDDDEDDQEVSDLPLPVWLEGDSLAPPCQAGMDVVRAIIDFAGVTDDDVLYDLGCGDGRICIEAAESRGAKAYGVEIEADLADIFRQRISMKGLESRVTAIHGDLRDVDLSDATVVVMYLLPDAMTEIAQSHLFPLLRRERSARNHKSDFIARDPHERKDDRQEKEGESDDTSAALGMRGAKKTKPCRIVCNTWGIPGATAVREVEAGPYGGVKLRLFTCESLPPPCESDPAGAEAPDLIL